jgi:exonuclease VII small subunit
MNRSFRWAALLLTLLAASVTLPAPASAQLGGLARKAKEAAKGKATDKVDESLYVPPPAPEFDDRTLEITEDNFAGLMAGLNAEVDYAKSAGAEYKAREKAYEQARKDFDAAMKEYDKRMDAYEACSERFRQAEDTAQAANERKTEALADMDDDEFEAYVEDLYQRGEAIARDVQAGKNDSETQRKSREYQAEVAAMQVEQSRRMAQVMSGMAAESQRKRTENPRLAAACGEEPERPVEPESVLGGPESVLADKGAEAAGLTLQQYAMMRERVLYWSDEDGMPSGMGYSEGEMTTLKAHKGDIATVVERMEKAQLR